MKKAPYMSKNELLDFLKVGCLCGELAAIAERTPDAKWRQKMKTCVTYLDGIAIERLTCMDMAQIESVKRRKDSSHIILQTEDQKRYIGGTPDKEIVHIAIDDLETLAELALNSCLACQEGLCVKDCRFRVVMHRVGIPVVRDDVVTGQCEFKLR